MPDAIMTGWLQFRPGDRERWLEHHSETIKESRKEPGNIKYIVVPDPENDTRIIFYESYVSWDAHKAHSASEHMKRSRELTEKKGCMWVDMEITKYDGTLAVGESSGPKEERMSENPVAPERPPLDLEQLNHIGIVVADIEAAMDDLGKVFGIDWTGVHHSDVSGMNFTQSVGQGGRRFELVEAKEGTLWNADWLGTQHIAVQVADLPAACALLEELGATQVTRLEERRPQTGGLYFRLRSGLLVEVSLARRPSPPT